MALAYFVPLLLVLQVIAAAPVELTELNTTEFTFLNETLELENATDTEVVPLGNNITSDNETIMEPLDNTDNPTSDETTTRDNVVAESVSYEPEPETTSPPPTKDTAKGLASLIQPSVLAFVLPICVRLLTPWNLCL